MKIHKLIIDSIKYGLYFNKVLSNVSKLMIHQSIVNEAVTKAYNSCKKKVGEKRANYFIIKFQKEAILGLEVNSNYIIRKLNEV